ncbi:hypothetical protein AVEN_38388-1 [Araneus ventricosus]|uniref:Uncharacterized protein n=1 Tax=Araneus ventricosus TaxID=182803 RepID=A0A4Y2SSG5_ARAVE|nr:hypothetical protein AVEN_38388-1 [Araneus ventricosus]
MPVSESSQSAGGPSMPVLEPSQNATEHSQTTVETSMPVLGPSMPVFELSRSAMEHSQTVVEPSMPVFELSRSATEHSQTTIDHESTYPRPRTTIPWQDSTNPRLTDPRLETADPQLGTTDTQLETNSEEHSSVLNLSLRHPQVSQHFSDAGHEAQVRQRPNDLRQYAEYAYRQDTFADDSSMFSSLPNSPPAFGDELQPSPIRPVPRAPSTLT